MNDNSGGTADARQPFGLSYAFGEPRISGRIRTRCEDFKVDEITAVSPDDEGEHLLLQLRKVGINTDWLAARLAEAFGVSRREVSYAGRKDRHAVTTQWFSVRQTDARPDGWQTRLPENVDVLAVHRHRRKLRRGALAGNRFVIVVRDLDGEVESLPARVEHIKAEGVPNYFGEQRFGHQLGNLASATIPVCYDLMQQQGRLKSGSNVLLGSSGSGIAATFMGVSL